VPHRHRQRADKISRVSVGTQETIQDDYQSADQAQQRHRDGRTRLDHIPCNIEREQPVGEKEKAQAI
jgi:hypothetical protein